MRIWNKYSSVCKWLAAVAAVRKQNRTWNVQREHQPVNTRGVCLFTFYLQGLRSTYIEHARRPAKLLQISGIIPVATSCNLKLVRMAVFWYIRKCGSVRQCAVVTNSQTAVHGVRRYWARGIAVVQHVSGADADCWLRGMSAAKALTLLTLL